MALVQLASGDWFPEEMLPVRNGQRYDPTAPSGGGAGAPPPQTNVAEPGQPAVMAGYAPPSREDILSRTLGGKTVLQPNVYTSSLMERPSTPPTIPKGSIAFQGPNGDWKFAKSVQEAGPLLQQGYQPTKQNGDRMKVENFQGGFLFDGLPINAALTGTMTEDQRQALLAGGRQVPGNISIVAGTGGNVDTGGTEGTTGGTTGTTGGTQAGGAGGILEPLYSGGYYGNQGATAPALPADIQDALRQLMQESRDQARQNQERLTGVTSDLKNFLGFTRAGAEQSFNRQNQLVDELLGRVTPGIESAIGTMNEATGLSPEAMVALRQQAVEGPQRDYQQQVEQLKTQLGARGAAGGLNPADLNATLSGYAPLMTSRDTSRQNLLANTILANEQRKFDTLGLNRQTAAAFGNIGAGLTTGLGNVYNPSQWLGGNEAALNSLLGTVNAQNLAGQQGLAQTGQFAGTLGELQPTSFKNTLLSALTSTGLGTLAGALKGLLTPSDKTVTETTTQMGPPWYETLGNIGINVAGTLGGLGGGNSGEQPFGIYSSGYGGGSNQLGAPRGGSLIV